MVADGNYGGAVSVAVRKEWVKAFVPLQGFGGLKHSEFYRKSQMCFFSGVKSSSTCTGNVDCS